MSALVFLDRTILTSVDADVDGDNATLDRLGQGKWLVVVSGYAKSKLPIFLVVRRDNELWDGQGVYHACEIVSDAGMLLLVPTYSICVECTPNAGLHPLMPADEVFNNPSRMARLIAATISWKRGAPERVRYVRTISSLAMHHLTVGPSTRHALKNCPLYPLNGTKRIFASSPSQTDTYFSNVRVYAKREVIVPARLKELYVSIC